MVYSSHNLNYEYQIITGRLFYDVKVKWLGAK